MEDELQQVKAMLRSVLLSSKEGVTEECFLEDYQSVTGELLPFKKFGYMSQSSFIESLPDVVHIRRNKFGETVYHAVADETTAHIQRLVSKQKSKKTKGPLRRLTSVRHPTKPFRGRGGYMHSRGRHPVSSWSAPSVRGGFEHKRGRGLAARGGYPVRGRTPLLNTPRDRPPLLSTPMERTPFSDTTQSQHSNAGAEIWVTEDIENVDNDCGKDESDNWDEQRSTLKDMKITFNVNNSSSTIRHDSASASRKVTDSNRMIFKALDATFLQQQALNKAKYNSKNPPRSYEVPPRFQNKDVTTKVKAFSSGTSKPAELSKGSSTVTNNADDVLIQRRVREILSDAMNGLWSTRVVFVYTEKYGEPPFDLIEKIKTWPHVAIVEPVPNTDRAIVNLVRDSPPAPVTVVTPVTSKPSTVTTPQTDGMAATKKPVIRAQPVIWKNFKIPPPDLLELGDRITVYVTFALRCDNFCVQREDCIVDFITDQLLIHCQAASAPSASVLMKGVYCAALYNEDKNWYRAQVLSEIQDEMVKVTFVDYGNTERVSVDNIRPLSAEIAHIPVQAIPCALFGVKVVDAATDGSTSPSVLAFAELVKENALEATTVAHTLTGQCEVELNVSGDSESINRQLIERQLVECSLASVEINRNGLEAEKPDTKEREIDGEPDELVLPDNKCWDVYVSFLTPNLEVNMRLVGEEYSDRLEELEKIMEGLYSLTNSTSPITDGMICIASVDNLFHRVRVYSVADGKASVYFCDHGDKEIIDTSKLRPLPPDLNRTLPYQAIQCHLYGFETLVNHVAALEVLLDLALGKILVAEVMSRDEDISVVLFDTESKEDTNINEIVALELKLQGVDIGDSSFSFSMFSDCTSIDVDAGDTDVITENDAGTEIDTKAEIDVSSERDTTAEINAGTGRDTTAEIDSRTEIDTSLRNLCLSPINRCVESDVGSDRDSLSEKDKDNLFYSGTETSGGSETDDGTKRRTETEKDARMEGHVGTETNSGSEKNVGSETAAGTEKSAVIEREMGLKRDAVMNSGDAVGLPPRLLTPAQGQLMDIHVIWVVDPSHFVFVLYEMMDGFHRMMLELNHEFNNSIELRPLPMESLQLEKVYAGCIDGAWYRVILKGFREEEASVYIPDQATFNITPATEIFDLPDKYLKLPFAAIKAELHGIEPTGSDWSESAKFKFVELVQNKDLVAFIVRKDDANGVMSLKLVDTSGLTDVCIDEVLIRGNFAKSAMLSGD
ncbi:tudor domain-containing protein 7-like isoform X1 [Gigantopelta aegis]|uniref:tudor domain-containing protein 7-like isoform X1 n=1 Tax=Gigantopelta aegis TaxID=1735272 RepID=UPI001B88AA47|nr:tudor domain-containing protein 7-like isoform X1 [Gigantopelta aegis]